MSRLATASAQAGGASLPALPALPARCLPHLPTACGGLVLSSWLESGVSLPWNMVPRLAAPTKQPQHGHSLWGISSPCHTPVTKHTAGCACLLPGSWAVALSTGNLVLELCTSAPASATKALLHLPPDTSPRCLAYPVTMRRYSQTQGQSVWIRDFANSPHGMSLLPPHLESSSGI